MTSGSSFLRFDPDDPIWPNRDRFVLSVGHASMLLYSMLHLTQASRRSTRSTKRSGDAVGHARRHQAVPPARQQVPRPPRIPLDRPASKPPPARSARAWPPASAWRIAGKWMAAHFNRPGFEMFDYDVYAICGDGCMMEGVSSEAASLAGHLKLSNLCWIYDNNQITIEGNTALAFSEDVATRFIAYGWNVTRVGDANDLEHARRAPSRPFQNTHGPPTLIIVDSHIAYGAPHKQDTSAAHGEPLGEEEIKLTKTQLRLARRREVPRPRRRLRALSAMASASAATTLRDAWMAKFEDYKAAVSRSSPISSTQMQHRELPDGWDKDIPGFPPTPRAWPDAMSRARCSNAIAKNVPWLIGGSADLAPSTKTRLTFEGAGDFEAEKLRRPQPALRHPRARHGLASSTAWRCRRSGPSARAS